MSFHRGMTFFVSLFKEVVKTVYVKENNDCGNDVHIKHFHALLNLKSLTCVGFRKEIIPAPAELFAAAEHCKDERTDGKKVAADDEIPQVKPCRTFAERLEA